MSVADKLLKAMTGMMELNIEVKNLVKRVDKMDDKMMDSVQRIARLETFVEIAEKQKKLK
jgi:predicted ATP-grasp superfamily ATP-dependent carboligase